MYIHTYIHTYIHIIHTYIHTYTHTYIHTFTYIRTYNILVQTCTYVHTYVYTTTYMYMHTHILKLYRLSPKKLQSAFWYRLWKNPLWNLKNQTRLWNYDYFSTIQWRPHLIWPCCHKEIWIFVRQVIGPFLPSFVTWMYVVSTFRLCSQKTGLQAYSNFMHTFLTKVVPDNLKACQICKIM